MLVYLHRRDKNMDYLPIGTVVTIEGMKEQKLMIYGRKQHSSLYDKNYDYVSVLYPAGNINDKFNFFFNNDDITDIIYKGYQSEEDDRFKEILNKPMKEE